ncbi:hypothetical protein RHS01_00720 [Rhizoctonia solani]|uniref:Transmembrane protein n=1 Tax=Rhizoctonia solani TaxID=456999 RepID=A0A8H7M9D6_9AGAM|nr:hypothetical protein RHS01_00720 [Rhizoctonia solani]
MVRSFAVSAFAVIGLLAAQTHAQTEPIWSNVTCIDQLWANNSMGWSPCLVSAHLSAQCTSDNSWGVPAIGAEGPWNLLSACSMCQGGQAGTWQRWTVNCSSDVITTPNEGGYPLSVPTGVLVPHWAYYDFTLSGVFNAVIASQQTGPESSAVASATSTSAPTSFISTPPIATGTNLPGESQSSGSNTGAIVGGVVGGIVGIALIAVIAFIVVRKNKQNQNTGTEGQYNQGQYNPQVGHQPSSGAPMMGQYQSVTQHSGMSPIVGSEHKPYDPSDPSTFPSNYNAPSHYAESIPYSHQPQSRPGHALRALGHLTASVRGWGAITRQAGRSSSSPPSHGTMRFGETSLAIPLFVVASVQVAYAQVTSNVTTCVLDYQWTINTLGQTPCLQSGYLSAQCNGGNWSVNGFPGGAPVCDFTALWRPSILITFDISTEGPKGVGQTCNTVVWNLLQACSLCQGGRTATWANWISNCSRNDVTVGRYPLQLPPSVAIQAGPTSISLPQVHSKLIKPAKLQLQRQAPTSTTDTPTPTSAPSGSNSNAGAIAGGVVGGVLGVALLGVLACYSGDGYAGQHEQGTGYAVQPYGTGAYTPVPTSQGEEHGTGAVMQEKPYPPTTYKPYDPR